MDPASVHGGDPGVVARALGMLALLALRAARSAAGRARLPRRPRHRGGARTSWSSASTRARGRRRERGRSPDRRRRSRRVLESIDGVVLSVARRTEDDRGHQALGHEAVDYVEPNFVVRAARLPNDLDFNELWGLHNLGQLGGNPGADISAADAWDVTGGGVCRSRSTPGSTTAPRSDGEHLDEPGRSRQRQDDDGNGFEDDVNGVDFLENDSDPARRRGPRNTRGRDHRRRGNNASGSRG